MSDKTKIEWTDATWNPVTGCSHVSAGCKNCYAEKVAHRFAGSKAYPNGFKVTLHPERLEQPVRWRRPRKIFVNSMSDLFHEDVPFEFIDEVFRTMGACDDQDRGHIFQILTKRPERMLAYMEDARAYKSYNDRRLAQEQWPPLNIWLGVSVENQETANTRLPILVNKIPAAVKFVSMEPLLGPVDISPWLYSGYLEPPQDDVIHWVIAGGESGPHARPMHPAWARGLRDQCEAAGTPFFFKQWGEWHPVVFDAGDGDIGITPAGQTDPESKPKETHDFPDGECMERIGKKNAGRMLDGREWSEFPVKELAA